MCWGVYEEYWYDALGRRVLKRSRQQSPICRDSSRCYSSIERVVWDGDNILWEVQQADSGDVKNPSGSGLTGQTGNIGYVSAGGLDAPLGMIRNGTAIVLHRNWKGLVTFATDDSGDPTTCAPDLGTGCDMVSFPGVTWGATLLHPDAMDTETWYGTVPMGFMDRTGLIYRRNRYYDPTSEQFTQPDPIGMAGGLGIYAYVGGDPVNGGDPYGLSCPPESRNCANIPGLTVTVHRGERGTMESVQWGLQGSDLGQQVIDLCEIDRETCEDIRAWKSGYRALLGERAARFAAERRALQQQVRISECRSARGELAMRILVDAGLVTAYGVGTYFVASGAFTMAVGAGTAGLLAGGSTTLPYLEEAGTAQYLAGAIQFWEGSEMVSSAASVPGLSPVPLVNSVGWVRAGGLAACDGL